MASLTKNFAGITHERLEENIAGLQWPCPTPDHPGTATLHCDGPIIGTAHFQPIEYRPSDELPDDEYPLVLSTGRILYHYNAATQTRRESGPVAKHNRNFIEISRKDAAKLGIEDGEVVEVLSRRGTVDADVLISGRMRRGCVWMPMHFAEARANVLTNDAGDPVTQTGEYKVCAVRIQKKATSGEIPKSELISTAV
ncbi:MAG: molybdopterin dinucleotide binding domain-containing protein [Pyrinomonadaceae bacterium]